MRCGHRVFVAGCRCGTVNLPPRIHCTNCQALRWSGQRGRASPEAEARLASARAPISPTFVSSDLSGLPRVLDGNGIACVDMGAQEFDRNTLPAFIHVVLTADGLVLQWNEAANGMKLQRAAVLPPASFRGSHLPLLPGRVDAVSDESPGFKQRMGEARSKLGWSRTSRVAGPRIATSRFEGEVTVTGSAGTVVLKSSSDLISWAAAQMNDDAGKRFIFALPCPTDGAGRFFRAVRR